MVRDLNCLFQGLSRTFKDLLRNSSTFQAWKNQQHPNESVLRVLENLLLSCHVMHAPNCIHLLAVKAFAFVVLAKRRSGLTFVHVTAEVEREQNGILYRPIGAKQDWKLSAQVI